MADNDPLLTDRKNLRLTFVETLSHQIDSEPAIDQLLQYLERGEDEVRMEVIRILSMTNTERVITALEHLLDDPNAAIREQALKSLVRIFPDHLFRCLEKGLSDTSEWVRLVAAKFFSQCRNEKVKVRKLLLEHLDDPNPDVTAQVVDSLSKLGDKQIVRPLFEKMRNCQQPKVQARIIEALARLKCADLITALYERLWSSAPMLLQIALVRALGDLKGENSDFQEWLLELLNDEDPFVRANAVHAVANTKLAVIEQIIAKLKDSHELVVRAAQEVLMQLSQHTPALVSLLITALEDANQTRHNSGSTLPTGTKHSSGSDAERQQLEQLAGHLEKLLEELPNTNLNLLLVEIIKNPRKVYLDRLLGIIKSSALANEQEYVNAVAQACSLPQPWMRYQLVTSLHQRIGNDDAADAQRAYRLNLIELLSRIRASQAIPLFVEMLNCEEVPVKIALLHALGEIRSTRVISAIKEFIDHPEWLVRVNVALALGKIGSNAVYSLLRHLAEDSNPWVRFNAVEAVRKLTEVDANDFFLEKLQDPDEKVRATAVMGVGLNARKEDFTILVKMLEDEDDRVRANAVEAIAFLQGKGVNEFQIKQALFGLLRDPHHRVRANAALTLYPICKEDVLKVLKTMLASSDKWDRSAAVFALGELGDLSAASLLIEMLYDEDSRVRMNTVKGLSKVRNDEINRLIIDSIAVVEEGVLQAVNEALEQEIIDTTERREYQQRIQLNDVPARAPGQQN